MKKTTLPAGFISLLIALSLGCDLTLFSRGNQSLDDQVATMVAKTVAAQGPKVIPATVIAPTGLPLVTPSGIASTIAIETATLTPSHTPSLTFTPTLLPGSVYSYSLLQTGEFMVVVQFKAPVSGQFTAIVDGKDFKCEILPQYPNRLYCYGPNPPAGKVVDININNTAEPGNPPVLVYYTSFKVPFIATATHTPRPQRTRKPKPPVITTPPY